MEHLEAFADISIRRACAFVGLGMVTVMISLSFDPTLAFRTGAEIAALLALGLAFAAWRAPRKNIRHTEVYAMLRGAGVPPNWLRAEVNRNQIAAVLRARLAWHAERVAITAVALWGLSLTFWLIRPG
jgi:heme A synthase